MAAKKTIFNNQWLDLSLHPSFDWLRKEDDYHGYCLVCKKRFVLGNMGKKAVVTYSKGQSHNKIKYLTA